MDGGTIRKLPLVFCHQHIERIGLRYVLTGSRLHRD
jgi:hypothetical protein